MVLKGKIYAWDEPLPLGKVVITDSQGRYKQPTKGVTADVNGNYRLDVEEADYIKAFGGGMVEQIIKVSDVCSQNSCNFDIKLKGKYKEEEAVYVYAPQKKPKLKVNTEKLALYGGASLLALALGILIFANIKKEK